MPAKPVKKIDASAATDAGTRQAWREGGNWSERGDNPPLLVGAVAVAPLARVGAVGRTPHAIQVQTGGTVLELHVVASAGMPCSGEHTVSMAEDSSHELLQGSDNCQRTPRGLSASVRGLTNPQDLVPIGHRRITA